MPYRGPAPNFSNQVSLQKEARKGEERASKESVNEVKFKANKQFFVKDDISNWIIHGVMKYKTYIHIYITCKITTNAQRF